jgi:PAS domain S-box-containing protein
MASHKSEGEVQTETDLSLALLETVFANSFTGFAFVDRDLRYRRINEELARINGQSVDAHLGRTVAEIIGPKRWRERRANFENALRGEAALDVKLTDKVCQETNAPRHVRASYLPVQVGGVVVGVAAIVKDITERTQAEQALQISEARKATILEVALDCIITIDQEGRIIEFNPAAERTFGHARQDIIGKLMAEVLVPPSLRPAHYIGFSHYLTTGEDSILHRRLEITALRANGEEFPIEIAIVPIQGDGQVLFTSYLRDISARKQDEQERERLLREVEESAERQRVFLRDVLASVTEGKLLLCHRAEELPAPRRLASAPISLSWSHGIRELRHAAEEAARAQGFEDERCYDLVTAASEAAMNAVTHAGGGEGQVFAGLDGTVQVWVSDHGAGIDIAHLPRATLEKGYTTTDTLGHGMKMMLQTADRIFLLTGTTGTTVVLEQDRLASIRVW